MIFETKFPPASAAVSVLSMIETGIGPQIKFAVEP